MATVFVWEGKTRQGAVQKGELAANSQEEVFALLRKQNILPDKCQSKAERVKIKLRGSESH